MAQEAESFSYRFNDWSPDSRNPQKFPAVSLVPVIQGTPSDQAMRDGDRRIIRSLQGSEPSI